MDTFTIMVVSSTMQDKSDCYVKVVKENFYCDISECIYPKIHLIFLSKQDYNKITEIEKMCEKYFDLERVEVDEEEKEYSMWPLDRTAPGPDALYSSRHFLAESELKSENSLWKDSTIFLHSFFRLVSFMWL